ncbi:MAG TPA: RNA polymerase sigma factor [Gemmatimonadaceae bacterium]|jgi:RNA polymerase sigma-70 factor, ECF subfamily|nr:RNA polymerase sigma factor [Gemmatimonadaceae bacterium]
MEVVVPPDAEIIASVVNGDIDAFTVLVQRYRDLCFRFALRILGNRDDAEEALQDAFVRAYRALPACRDRARFGAWLYQILVNECRTRATRTARRDRHLVDVTPDVADPASHEDSAVSEEIEYALAQLVPEQREVFLLRYVEELGYDEIAEITGVGVSALKMRAKRGCERLRELLEGVVR